jgi:alginate O-acetyltransferase complex protein AlgI
VVFSSLIFMFYFLPLFLLSYYFAGARNGALLFGSAVFYTWGEGLYLILLAALVVVNYYLGLHISTATGRKMSLAAAYGVAFNLLILVVFKYAGFLIDIARTLTKLPLPKVDIHLPLGISFFIFQLISYIIDVGRNQIPGDRSIVRFATYIMMFPHLIAGPIVRYADIDAELHKRTADEARIGLGLQYFIIGLCQKVLIANTVAAAADKAFGMPVGELTALAAWTGVLAYTLQIYFDFCGYSNMAIGLAFMLGFRFPRNFDYPYMSRSITEFWRRWHISLSFWFRDYVYIPLGGNKFGPLYTTRNLLIVFFLTGLWHGASWTFVLWGLFHGAFIMAERVGLRSLLERLPAACGWAYSMLVVMVGWVLFRSNDLAQAHGMLSAMFGFGKASAAAEPIQLWLTLEIAVALLMGVVFSFPVLPYLLKSLQMPELAGPVVPGTAHAEVTTVNQVPTALLVIGFVLSCALLVGSSLNPFLYFRF